MCSRPVGDGAKRPAGHSPPSADQRTSSASDRCRRGACGWPHTRNRSSNHTTWLSPSKARMCVQTVEEPPIVGNDHGAAGEAHDALLEGPQGADVDVVRGLVQ